MYEKPLACIDLTVTGKKFIGRNRDHQIIPMLCAISELQVSRVEGAAESPDRSPKPKCEFLVSHLQGLESES